MAKSKRPLPKRATIGAFEYRISFDAEDFIRSDENPEQLFGFTDHQRGLIIIHPNSSHSMQRTTLLHELLHASAFVAGQIHSRKRTEEDWVVMVAPALLDALQRSPEVVDFLLNSPRGGE